MRARKRDIEWDEYIQSNFSPVTLAWLIDVGIVVDYGGILLPRSFYKGWLASEREIPGYQEFDRRARRLFKNEALRNAMAANAARLADIRAKKAL